MNDDIIELSPMWQRRIAEKRTLLLHRFLIGENDNRDDIFLPS